MSHSERGREVIGIEIAGLQKVRDGLGSDFDKAVDMLLAGLRSGGKIVVTGVGKSFHIAQKVSGTLSSTGSTSVALNPTQAMHGDLGVLNSNDILLVLSYSGETEELIALIPIVKRLGVKTIVVTGSAHGSLASYADVTVLVTVEREACPFNMAPTSSTTASLALGDALAMTLLEAQGFVKEDYAKLHPGGAIGRSLLLRVADIMRTGERLASVSHCATVRDAVFAMTEARSGSAAVVDDDGGILGIVTDGDLRRHLTDSDNLINMRVDDIMTSSPVTVFADELAVHVLKLFEERNIDDILVLDRDNRLVGAVDIQDLPKLKIM